MISSQYLGFRWAGIYHATHQFFLTRRSVYVLVCDDRKEDTDFGYWLKSSRCYADASPLLDRTRKNIKSRIARRDIGVSSVARPVCELASAIATNLDTNRGLDRSYPSDPQ